MEVHDQLVLALEEDLSDRISPDRGAVGVLIDISAVDMVDSFIGRMIGQIAMMATILGARTVVAGMSPAVAITLVELGLALPGVRTALDVEKGLANPPGRGSIVGPRRSAMASVTRTESRPIATEADVVQVRQAVRRLVGRDRASAWSTRPR